MGKQMALTILRMALVFVVTGTIAGSIHAQQTRSIVRRNEAERRRRDSELKVRTARSRQVYAKQQRAWRQWKAEPPRANKAPGGVGPRPYNPIGD